MIEEFVSLGEWWLLNQPEVVVPGKLSFSPNSGTKLELFGSFYNHHSEEIDQRLQALSPLEALGFVESEEKIILGRLDNKEEVTLYKCFGRPLQIDFINSRATFFFQATYIFRKIHLQTEQEIQFKSISVRYAQLEEWIGICGVEATRSSSENKVSISYQPPVNIPLAEIEEFNISITFSPIPSDLFLIASSFGGPRYKGSLEQKTFLNLQNPKNRSIEQCVELIVNFSDFLSFAMASHSSIVSVTGNVDITYENVILKDDGTYTSKEEIKEAQANILFTCGNPEKRSDKNKPLHEMLFVYREVNDQLGMVFKEWLNKKKEYEFVLELFLTTMYAQNLYLHHGFINIIQAL